MPLADWAVFMVPKAKKTLGKVIAIALVTLVAIIALGWLFVVPRELKTIIGFSQWHKSHVRASGYVGREPAGTRVYWEEFGKADGPPVVVLPAGLCTIAVMGGQIERLATESYHVIAIDSRGNGRSSNTAPVLTYEMMSDDVVGVMDALKIARTDIVGWSDGGNLGLDLARRYPARVHKVVAFGANHTPAPDGVDPAQVKEFKEAKADSAMFWPLRYMYPEELADSREVARVLRAGADTGVHAAPVVARAAGHHSGASAPHQRRTRPRASAVRDRDEKCDPRGAARDHPRWDARGACGGPRRREPAHAVVPQTGGLSDAITRLPAAERERAPLSLAILARMTSIMPIRCSAQPAGAMFPNRAASVWRAVPALTALKRRR